MFGAGERRPDAGLPIWPGVRAARSDRPRARTRRDGPEHAFAQARIQGRDRLGDGDTPRRQSSFLDPQPRQARAQVVEAEALGSVFMTQQAAASLGLPEFAADWLQTH